MKTRDAAALCNRGEGLGRKQTCRLLDTLIRDAQPPALGENEFLLSKPPRPPEPADLGLRPQNLARIPSSHPARNGGSQPLFPQ